MTRSRDGFRFRFAWALAAACMLAACAGPRPRPPAGADAERCLALFDRVDAAVAHERVGDALATHIAGFPYLRVDRLLASFRDELADEAAQRFWIGRLGELDADARAMELANLPAATLAALQDDTASTGRTADLLAALAECRAELIAADLSDAVRFGALRQAATVPDDYSLARRVAGLYPLTRLPFAAGVRAFEREVAQTFELPLDALPQRGRLRQFVPAAFLPPDRAAQSRMIRDAAANPLGIPIPDAETVRRLAEAHAPVFEVDVATGDDLIGTPQWSPQRAMQERARIDTGHPAVFYRAAQTRVGGQVLLQLVYTAWFPARPRRGALDLLAGRLDGLIWRVTLAPDGEPLLFDSIHACGCYHFFFPTAQVRVRPAPGALDEWAFAPQALPRQADGERVVLRVAAGTHYLQRVRYEARAAAAYGRYALIPDDTLRSLPRADGTRRSLYTPDGFVAGSERAERFLFWPMGIAKPGTMRQWGHHATAFVGRRHFDDPRLIDARFEIDAYGR
jgi:hypothetical protein